MKLGSKPRGGAILESPYMYEFHISVPRDTPIKNFIYYCEAFDIKYAILSLSNGQLDLMTSVKNKNLVDILSLLQLFPNETRVKIECRPTTSHNALYYEAHYEGFVIGLPWAVNIVKNVPVLSSTLRKNNITFPFQTLNK